MEIRTFEWEQVEIPLKKPFKIALGTTEVYRGVILRICTEEYCGYGEAAPSPRITGETTESVIGALKKMKSLVLGKNPLDVGRIMNDVNRAIVGNTSAKSAVDMALHDILGKRSSLPLYMILGGERDRIPTSLTVGLGSVKDTVKSSKNLISQGARILKVKIGGDPEEDIERIRAIREITDIPIRVDANQGYTLKRAMYVLRSIYRYDVEFVEQPIPAKQIEDLAILRKETEIPIMADESAHSKEDVLRLIGKVDAINIKLMKSGGIREAIRIISLARAAGMKVMVGCMVETKLGISAGAHFALGYGADYADLDGFWDLSSQPFEGVKFKDGFIEVSERAGLGIVENKENP